MIKRNNRPDENQAYTINPLMKKPSQKNSYSEPENFLNNNNLTINT